MIFEISSHDHDLSRTLFNLPEAGTDKDDLPLDLKPWCTQWFKLKRYTLS